MYLPYITVIRTDIDLLTILLGSLYLFKLCCHKNILYQYINIRKSQTKRKKLRIDELGVKFVLLISTWCVREHVSKSTPVISL